MIALVSQRPPERITAYPFIVDLREISGTPKGQATIQLWEGVEGTTVGFTLLDGPFLTFDISPSAVFDDLAEEMIAWATEKLASSRDLPVPPEKLVTNCREEDTQRLSFLRRHGFSAQSVRTLHFLRPLTTLIPAPQLPYGFLIRPILGEEEVGEWVKLHQAAHGTANMTAEFRLSMMHTTEYQPDLDLVAVAPDGQLAAYAMCRFSLEENCLHGQKVGHTDPIATHPNFQRQGLARALLLAGFTRLRKSGVEFAEVSTWGENIGMIKTAASVGCRLYATSIFLDHSL